MVGVSFIGPRKPIWQPGSPRVVQSCACLPRTRTCNESLRLN